MLCIQQCIPEGFSGADESNQKRLQREDKREKQVSKGKSSGIISGCCVDALVACIANAVRDTRASTHIGMKAAFRGEK